MWSARFLSHFYLLAFHRTVFMSKRNSKLLQQLLDSEPELQNTAPLEAVRLKIMAGYEA